MGCDSSRWFDNLEQRNICSEPERQCDPLGHIVQFPVRRGSATATFPPCNPITITPGTGPIVPGTTDTGNHCDDCITTIALPFAIQLYGNSYISVNLSSNGTAQFVTSDSTFVTVCIPWAGHDFAIHLLFQDLRTDAGLSGCSAYPGG